MICGGYNSSGYATYYAHNGARNNTPRAFGNGVIHTHGVMGVMLVQEYYT